ncbi:MAG TPA: hypothetical protein VGL75_07770 [Acidothermaceae bacterium]|jgi:hypothetical protein
MAQVLWENAPDAHDYPAADSYLSLLVGDIRLRAALIARLQSAPVSHYKAKDLLRASREPLLTTDNPHVAVDLRKIRKGRALSPVLLVRGDLLRGFPLQIADGYHRVCASFWVNENTDIPCRLIDLSSAEIPTRELVKKVAAAKKAAPATKTVAAKKAAPAKKAAQAKKSSPTKKAAPRKVARKVLAKKAPAAVISPPAPEAAAQPVSPSA